jgi:hypothetical protein
VQLQYARKHALAQNIIYKKEYARQHDADNVMSKPELSLDDQILVACQPKQKFKNAKLHPVFEGPYPIVKLSPPNIYFPCGKKGWVAHLNRVKKASTALQSLEPKQIVAGPRVHARRAGVTPFVVELENDLPGEEVDVNDLGCPHSPHASQAEYLSDSSENEDEFFDLSAETSDLNIPASSRSTSPEAAATGNTPSLGKSRSVKPNKPTCLADLLLFSGPATRSCVWVPDIPLPPFKLGGKVLEKFKRKKGPPE